MTKKYIEQYERVKRWYEKLKIINEGGELKLPNTDYYEDEMLAFFINCYHLKDWIMNDPISKVEPKLIEDFITNSKYLSICADICNGTKHLTLNNSRTGKSMKIGGRDFSLTLRGIKQTFSAKYKIISGDRKYDAFELATKCIEDWDQFLDLNKLV